MMDIKSLHKENRVCLVAVTNVFMFNTGSCREKHFYNTFLFSTDLKLIVNRERSVPFGCIWSFYDSNAADLTESGARMKAELAISRNASHALQIFFLSFSESYHYRTTLESVICVLCKTSGRPVEYDVTFPPECQLSCTAARFIHTNLLRKVWSKR